jgi:hypothetical protein
MFAEAKNVYCFVHSVEAMLDYRASPYSRGSGTCRTDMKTFVCS